MGRSYQGKLRQRRHCVPQGCFLCHLTLAPLPAEPQAVVLTDAIVFLILFTFHPGFNSGWALSFLAPFLRIQAVSLDFSRTAHTFFHPLYISFCVSSPSGVPCSRVLAFCHACADICMLEWSILMMWEAVPEDQPAILRPCAFQGSLSWDHAKKILKQAEICYSEAHDCSSTICFAYFSQNCPPYSDHWSQGRPHLSHACLFHNNKSRRSSSLVGLSLTIINELPSMYFRNLLDCLYLAVRVVCIFVHFCITFNVVSDNLLGTDISAASFIGLPGAHFRNRYCICYLPVLRYQSSCKLKVLHWSYYKKEVGEGFSGSALSSLNSFNILA